MTSSADNDELRRRLSELRATSLERADRLAASFADIVEGASDVATDDEHDPEGHTIAWERQQLAALIDEARQTAVALNAALRRTDEGTYGRCTACGDEINAARLEALPATATCISCAV